MLSFKMCDSIEDVFPQNSALGSDDESTHVFILRKTANCANEQLNINIPYPKKCNTCMKDAYHTRKTAFHFRVWPIAEVVPMVPWRAGGGV